MNELIQFKLFSILLSVLNIIYLLVSVFIVFTVAARPLPRSAPKRSEKTTRAERQMALRLLLNFITEALYRKNRINAIFQPAIAIVLTLCIDMWNQFMIYYFSTRGVSEAGYRAGLSRRRPRVRVPYIPILSAL